MSTQSTSFPCQPVSVWPPMMGVHWDYRRVQHSGESKGFGVWQTGLQNPAVTTLVIVDWCLCLSQPEISYQTNTITLPTTQGHCGWWLWLRPPWNSPFYYVTNGINRELIVGVRGNLFPLHFCILWSWFCSAHGNEKETFHYCSNSTADWTMTIYESPFPTNVLSLLRQFSRLIASSLNLFFFSHSAISALRDSDQ